MNLTKIHPGIDRTVVVQQIPELNPFLCALNSKKVLESSDSEIANVLAKAVSNATFYLKHKPGPSEEFDLTIDALLVEIKQNFRGLTLDEIKLACLCGSKHQYGEIMGVGVSQVLRWLSAFISDQRRHKAKRDLMLAQEARSSSREVTEDDYKELALNAFKKYKEVGKYEDYGNIIYDFLDCKNVINFSNQRKKDIERTVKEIELKRLSMPRTLHERNSFKIIMEKILSGDKDELRRKCKRYALNVFFADLVEMDADLEISASKDSLNMKTAVAI